MKRSTINALIRSAQACYQAHGWTLPPKPRWDVTDFGLGNWQQFGLVLVNLAEEPEYCEKLMYARKGMTTPAHCHRKKKEDIICRWGKLAVQVWAGLPSESRDRRFTHPGESRTASSQVRSGDRIGGRLPGHSRSGSLSRILSRCRRNASSAKCPPRMMICTIIIL